MLKDLIKVANELDALGLTKEADVVDSLIGKVAGKWSHKRKGLGEDAPITNFEPSPARTKFRESDVDYNPEGGWEEDSGEIPDEEFDAIMHPLSSLDTEDEGSEDVWN
jgi:hypothetical protein